MAECNVCHWSASGLYQLSGCACLVCPACYVASSGWCPMHRVHPPSAAPIFRSGSMFADIDGEDTGRRRQPNCVVCCASAERCMQHPACPHTPLTDVRDDGTVFTSELQTSTTFPQLASVDGVVPRDYPDCDYEQVWRFDRYRLWQPHRDTLFARTGPRSFTVLSARNMLVKMRHIGGTETRLVQRVASLQSFTACADVIDVTDASTSLHDRDTGKPVPPCVALQLIEAKLWSRHMLAVPALAHFTLPEHNPRWRAPCRATVHALAPATATSPAVNVGVVDTDEGRRFVCTACGDTCTWPQFLERHVAAKHDAIRVQLNQLAAAAPSPQRQRRQSPAPSPKRQRRQSTAALLPQPTTTYHNDVTVMRCTVRVPDGETAMTAFARYAVAMFEHAKVTSVALVGAEGRWRHVVLLHPDVPPGHGVTQTQVARDGALGFSDVRVVDNAMTVNGVMTRVNSLLATATPVTRFPPDIATKDRGFSYVGKNLMYAWRR